MLNPKFLDDILEETGCLAGLQQEAGTAVEEAVSSSLLGASARDSLEKIYVERLTCLYRNPLFMEMQEKLRQEDITEALTMAGTNRNAYVAAGAEAAVKTKGGSSAFFRQKYPLFGGYEDALRKNFIQSIRLFEQHLLASQSQIARELLGGAGFKEILSFSCGGADPHRGGRQVLQVVTEQGNFYYKPRNSGLDVFYRELISSYFPSCTEAPRVAAGKDFAFVSELVRRDLPGEEDAATYYFNFGMLAAIFHGLGSSDMHCENILPCGIKPAAVDIEMVLSPKSAVSVPRHGNAFINLDLQYSLFYTGILPYRTSKRPLFSPLYRAEHTDAHLPCHGEKKFTVEGFEDDFLAGFLAGYQDMRDRREEIEVLLQRHKDMSIRHLVHNTAYYAYLRTLLFWGKYMVSEEQQAKVLAKLEIPFRRSSMDLGRQPVMAREKEALLQGDIPYFCVSLQGHALCGDEPEEKLQEGYFDKSPAQHFHDRLARLSPAECLFEEDLLRYFLSHVPLSEEPQPPPSLSPQSLQQEKLKEAGQRIWQELKGCQLRRTDGFSIWPSIALSYDSPRPADISFLWADVARYCGQARQVAALANEADEMKETARMCLTGLARQAGIWHEFEGELLGKGLPLGLYAGIGSLFAACSANKDLQEAQDLAATLLNLTRVKALHRGKAMGMDYGLAGLLLGLARAKKENLLLRGEAEAMIGEIATELAKRELPQTAGGSGGLDAIGAALAAARFCSGEPRFARAAVQCFQKVRDMYQERLEGWPEKGGKMDWLAGKAPWSASIAYWSMEALDYLPDGEETAVVREVRELALASVRAEGALLWLDSLHEGNAMSVLCLLKAAEQTCQPACQEEAAQRLAAMLSRYEAKGTFTVMPQGVRSFFDSSFAKGTLGIGYVLAKALGVLS